jgi:hydrogenase expression/formation protein HypC
VVYIEIPFSRPWVEAMLYGNAMQVQEIDGLVARCITADGAQSEVDITLMDDEPVEVGDFVLVHVGFAIRRVDPEEVRLSMDLDDDCSSEESL